MTIVPKCCFYIFPTHNEIHGFQHANIEQNIYFYAISSIASHSYCCYNVLGQNEQ